MTWFELTLHHGPKLVHQRSDREDPALDVTDRASEFLFSQMRLADDVTLLDVFKLLDNPVLRTVFRGDFANEILTEAALGPMSIDELPHERIDYLELNQLWYLDSSTSEFTSVGKFCVTGKGIAQPEDVVEDDVVVYNKGERIHWSVSMTSVRELLHLPVRINSTVQICEEDVYAKRFGHALQTGVNRQITLGTLIHSLLWAFSWYGTPAQRDAKKGDLLESKAEFEAGAAELVPYESVSEALGDLPTSKVYSPFFEDVGLNPLESIERAISELEDGESAQFGLNQAFGGVLVLKQEFASFTGRELRVAVSDVRSPNDKRLMGEERVEFQAKLSNLVNECRSTETAIWWIDPADEFLQNAINVQLALKELGQEVSVSVAAAVWAHHSNTLAASWMAGADTVRSAQNALFSYVASRPSI